MKETLLKLVALLETNQIDKDRLATSLDKAIPKKRGRKKLETKGKEPRNETVICRLTKTEKTLLMEFTQSQNESVSDFLRKILMDYVAKHRQPS
ncbi:MAG: hypothetical protein HYZ42_01410 [Bacteroidetes bacterium]|nr:hypothetical protein [Bacteroidota bacterium]